MTFEFTPLAWFLMHRVELKEHRGGQAISSDPVPNAPCGVESRIFLQPPWSPALFLMHRVELKDPTTTTPNPPLSHKVPNAPCGVESGLFHDQGSLKGVAVPNAPCGVESRKS